MTGPLAPLFAQVRETLECPNQDAPMHTRTGCTYCSATADAFAALSAIERHVQDMERALREIDRRLTSTGGSLSPRHADHYNARESARAALSAREKEGE